MGDLTLLAIGLTGLLVCYSIYQGRILMADFSKLQASVSGFLADQTTRFAAIQKQLDGLNAGSPVTQATIDALQGQVDSADAALKAFDPSAV